jgi:hypothetical protein
VVKEARAEVEREVRAVEAEVVAGLEVGWVEAGAVRVEGGGAKEEGWVVVVEGSAAEVDLRAHRECPTGKKVAMDWVGLEDVGLQVA